MDNGTVELNGEVRKRPLRWVLEDIYTHVKWAKSQGFCLTQLCSRLAIPLGVLRQLRHENLRELRTKLRPALLRILCDDLAAFRQRYANLPAFSPERLRLWRRRAGLTIKELEACVSRAIGRAVRLRFYEITGGRRRRIDPALWDKVSEVLVMHCNPSGNTARMYVDKLLAKGWSFSAIADAVGVMPGTLAKFARRQCELRAEVVDRIIDLALDVMGNSGEATTNAGETPCPTKCSL
jgi:transcriptional regulator with XRE-family HTH domain